MFTRNLLTAAAAVLLIAVAMTGCSNKADDDKLAQALPAMDSIAKEVAKAQIETTPPKVVLGEKTGRVKESQSATINGTYLDGSTLYAAYEEGLIVYDLATDQSRTIPSEAPLSAVVRHVGQLYTGGDKLFRLTDTTLEKVDGNLGGAINVLYSYGATLLIGTESGLYSQTPLGNIPLMEGVWVTAITADTAGVWVGTDGDGLYYWNGDKFTRRSLSRDSSLFDYVTALDFGHGHLYLGTNNGLFVYDGGRWQPYGIAEGLPSDNITAIDASGWVIYIGTDEGATSLFKNALTPVRGVETQSITSIRQAPRGLIVGTECDGLLLRSGDAIRTLVAPKPSLDLALLVF